MAIQQAKFDKIKTEATTSIARSKARQAQITANAHVLKAKRMIEKAKAKSKA